MIILQTMVRVCAWVGLAILYVVGAIFYGVIRAGR